MLPPVDIWRALVKAFLDKRNKLKAASQFSVFHTYAHARKSLNSSISSLYLTNRITKWSPSTADTHVGDIRELKHRV